MIKIFFENRPLIVLKKLGKYKALKGDFVYIFKNSDQLIDLIFYFEKHKEFDRLIVVHKQTNEILDIIRQKLRYIVAAGGVVFNEKKELLSILRRNKWDLPKGKAEEGESIEETAIREVREECGIQDLIIKKELKPTYHTYWLKDKFVLKKTVWYKMKHTSNETLVPQTAEEIIEARYYRKSEIPYLMEHTYQSIKEVLKQVI